MARSKFPGPISQKALQELLKVVICDPYPFCIDLKKSSGMSFATLDSQSIFDWSGVYASRLLGYNHPDLNSDDYRDRLVLAANNKMANPDFLTLECLEYYKLLHFLAPDCMKNPKLEVYAVNSGAEAVENMMKYMISLHHEKLLQKKKFPSTHRFIYFDQAFHGRTLFALNITQLTHDPIITKGFQGFIPGNLQVPFPAIDSEAPDSENLQRTTRSLEIVEDLLKRYGDEIVGIIVEPIQGAGGHRVAQKQFFQGLSQLAHHYGCGLGFDEVQTAGGQTGTFFAIDQFDLPFPPDAIAVAKKLANGAVYMFRPLEDQGVLDSTWGGSLADMVRFCEEMKVVRKERLIEQVDTKTKRLIDGLLKLKVKFPDLICNIRGMGLYQGFSFKDASLKGKFIQDSLEIDQTFFLGAGPDSIRLRPPIDVTTGDIDRLLEIIDRRLLSLVSELA